MTTATTSIASLIQLSSADPLWDWHVPSDTLFLSRGACEALRLPEADIPVTMADFLARISPNCLPKLYDMREGVLNGLTGALLETTYPLGELLVKETLLVLERDESGRGVRVVGRYAASPMRAYAPLMTLENNAPEMGYWHWRLRERTITIDGGCAVLIGYADAKARTFSLDEWKERFHPEDKTPHGGCRYQLTIDHAFMGDSIDDVIHIRLENGQYAPFVLRGSILERDDNGAALEMAGALSLMDAAAGRQKQSQDAGRLLMAIQSSGDGLWDWDAKTDEVYFSPRYLSMIGYTAEEFPGNLDVWRQKIHPEDYDKIVPYQAALVQSPLYGDSFECTYRLRRKDGTWAWILGRGYVTHRDAEGKATRLVGLHTDITATQGDRERLEELVKNDPLTGLRSRSYLDMEIKRIEKNRIRPIGVMMADVNGLKLINDYLGHAEGDALLSQVALMLRHALRATDCVARVGGDEFTVLLPGCSQSALDRILKKTRVHFDERNADPAVMPIFVSIGAACIITPSTSVRRAIMDADRAMLREKNKLRYTSRERIKNWIESGKGIAVSLEDSRYL